MYETSQKDPSTVHEESGVRRKEKRKMEMGEDIRQAFLLSCFSLFTPHTSNFSFFTVGPKVRIKLGWCCDPDQPNKTKSYRPDAVLEVLQSSPLALILPETRL